MCHVIQNVVACSSIPPADLEAAEAGRRLFRYVEGVDIGAPRAVAAGPHDGVDRLAAALEHGFDAAVGAVPHPPRDAARPRARRDEHAEPDTVHATVDDHAPAHDYGFSTTFRQLSRFFLNVS